MSAEVIQLAAIRQKREADILAGERLIWACGCGCTEFSIYADVGAICNDCDARQANLTVTIKEKSDA